VKSNCLVFEIAVGARQHCDHIVRFEIANFADHVSPQLCAQVYGMEIGERASAIHLVEIHAGTGS